MSRVLEDRVLTAHPLSPAHRMVLLMVARAITDGQNEALVNRAALARSLDARPDLVNHAFVAGEQIGLCRVLRSGRVAFSEDGLFDARPVSATGPPAVRETQGDAERPVIARPTIPAIFAEFGRQWSALYGQRYIFVPGKDHRLAKALAAELSAADLATRIANYLQHPDPFYRECMHAFGVFANSINKFGCTAAEPKSRIPNADQTRRYIEGLRGKSS
jgi:hypothetical protein